MVKPIHREESAVRSLPVGTLNRAYYFILDGYRNSPLWPTRPPESPLKLSYQLAEGCVASWVSWTGASGFQSLDAPNMSSYYYAHSLPWDSRLYSQCYSRFTQRARQGSAEWGMNIVQGRKALQTFVSLAETASVAVTAWHMKYRDCVKWLSSHPDATPNTVKRRRRQLGRTLVRAREKRERTRLSNEIWLLDRVSSSLLAYRYGVAPLMSDLYTTSQVLSQEFKDAVELRQSQKRSWSSANSAMDDKWSGTETVVLRATVHCSNPNLALANRLGIINPQMWIWDATPWSFVVDWWFPVGSFLANFTALVGITLTSASVTRTRAWAGVWIPNGADLGRTYVAVGDMRFTGKRKEREPGTFPIPKTIAYGTGLGIQRGQNALALIAQKLGK